MRGKGRMIAIVTTGMMTLFCQGCVHSGQAGTSGPAAAVNRAMLLAAGQAEDTGLAGLTLTAASGSNGAERRILAQSSAATLLGPAAGVQDFADAGAGGGGFDMMSTPWRGPATIDGLTLSGTGILQGVSADLAVARLSPAFEVERSFGGEITLSAGADFTGLPLDVGIAPRAAFRKEGAYRSRRFGAEFRLGEGLDERGRDSSARSWYVFAGADGEALCWDVGDKGITADDSVRLRDQVTVGDLQAGVSMQTGGGQLSFSYIRREVSYTDASTIAGRETEDFAGLSFTIRR